MLCGTPDVFEYIMPLPLFPGWRHSLCYGVVTRTGYKYWRTRSLPTRHLVWLPYHRRWWPVCPGSTISAVLTACYLNDVSFSSLKQVSSTHGRSDKRLYYLLVWPDRFGSGSLVRRARARYRYCMVCFPISNDSTQLYLLTTVLKCRLKRSRACSNI